MYVGVYMCPHVHMQVHMPSLTALPGVPAAVGAGATLPLSTSIQGNSQGGGTDTKIKHMTTARETCMWARHVQVCMCVCVDTDTCAQVCVHAQVGMCVQVCVHVCTCMCMHVEVHVCVCSTGTDANTSLKHS